MVSVCVCDVISVIVCDIYDGVVVVCLLRVMFCVVIVSIKVNI